MPDHVVYLTLEDFAAGRQVQLRAVRQVFRRARAVAADGVWPHGKGAMPRPDRDVDTDDPKWLAGRPEVEAYRANDAMDPRLKDKKWLRAEYVDADRSVYDLARELECAEKTVTAALSDAGIKLKDSAQAHRRVLADVPLETMRDVLSSHGGSTERAAQHFGVSRMTFEQELGRKAAESAKVPEPAAATG